MPAFHFVKNTVSPTFVFDPLQRSSNALESSIGRLCFFIEGVPPQSNHPSVAVLALWQVSNTIEKEQCYTFAYPHPKRCGITAPAYAGQFQSNYNNRLWLSSTGSSFPSRSPRHVHREVGSPGLRQGQLDARYAIHASRQLSGEVLRYLKQSILLTKLLDYIIAFFKAFGV